MRRWKARQCRSVQSIMGATAKVLAIGLTNMASRALAGGLAMVSTRLL
jgi:hypothetical protein